MSLNQPRIDRLLIVEGDDYGRDTLGQSLIGCTMSSAMNDCLGLLQNL
jgi:hypothetical protein